MELSIVVPVYQNAPSLEELHMRVLAAMQASNVAPWDITYVNDGSTDASAEVLQNIQKRYSNARVVTLSRNFGSQAATFAGISYATGRCVAVLAADLQDPPEVLPLLIERWRSGVQVVLAERTGRDDPWATRLFAWIFYKVFRLLVSRDMPPGGVDFFLIDRQVADVLLRSVEKNSNLGAALLWMGFAREFVGYHRARRPHGSSMWTFPKKFKYMYDSLLSFSYVPLRCMAVAGVAGILSSLAYGVAVFADHWLNHATPPGWASLMLVTLFFNGLLLASVGVVGEYVWRTYDAARSRPLYIIARSREPSQDDKPHVAAG